MNLNLFKVAILTATILPAQSVSLGVKGGIPTLDSTVARDESKRYVIGPTVEVSLPASFAIEADALYQRLGDSSNLLFPITATGTSVVGLSPVSSFPFTLRQRGNSWEFPLLMKYYLHPVKHLNPFVSGGFAFRTIGIDSKGIEILTFPNSATQTVPFQTSLRTNLAVGAVGAVGLRFKVGHFAIAPEFRYTRYGSDDHLTDRNSANLLIGLTF